MNDVMHKTQMQTNRVSEQSKYENKTETKTKQKKSMCNKRK